MLRARIGLPWLGPVFISLALACFVNVLTTALTNWSMGWAWGVVFILFGLAGGAVVAYNLIEVKARLGRKGNPHPRKHRGLVFLGCRQESLSAAVRHHLPTLKRCWLVVTPEKEEEAVQVIAQLMPDVPGVDFSRLHLTHLNNTEECYSLVKEVFEKLAPANGISPIEVIGDITGGSKTMSIGMMRACLEGAYHMEYVPVDLDAETGSIRSSLPPIWIRVG